VGIALAASLFTTALPGLRDVGGVIGAGVSAAFLWIIGFLNLRVLLELVSAWRTGRARGHGHAHVDELLQQRGVMNRLLGGRLRQWMRHSWQMFPLGLLFGMGFDTASEIALLALTAGAATGHLPLGAVLSLPLLFAAGMTLLDTTDGVLMCRAYAWASREPARRMLCNITTTAVTVAVALLIGTLGWLQVVRSLLGLRGGVFDFADALDPGALGGMVVGLLLVTWVACAVWFRWRQAGSAARLPHVHAHPHTHANGVTHSHRHLH
jgi:high-affinity nickel-transport protein